MAGLHSAAPPITGSQVCSTGTLEAAAATRRAAAAAPVVVVPLQMRVPSGPVPLGTATWPSTGRLLVSSPPHRAETLPLLLPRAAAASAASASASASSAAWPPCRDAGEGAGAAARGGPAAAHDANGVPAPTAPVDYAASTPPHAFAGVPESSPAVAASEAGTSVYESEHARFWKPAVARLYRLYAQPRHGAILVGLAQLTVHQWRHLLDFAAGLRAFLARPPDAEQPAPPDVPFTVLAHILSAYATGCPTAPAASSPPASSAPLWYLEALQVLRLQLAPRESVGRTPSAAPAPTRGPPSRSIQCLVHLLTAAPVAALLQDWVYGVHVGQQGDGGGPEADSPGPGGGERLLLALSSSWARHGGDVLLAVQHVLIRLYPDPAAAELPGPRLPVPADEVPSIAAVALAAACHFSAQLLAAPSTRATGSPMSVEDGDEEEQGARLAAAAGPSAVGAAPGAPCGLQFSSMLRALELFRRPPLLSQSSADKFLASLRDVLRLWLGPGPAAPEDLPEPVPPHPMPEGAAPEPSDIKVLARILRRLIQAYYTEPALLAAQEERERACREASAEDARSVASLDSLTAGSFAGPSGPGDIVLVPDSGPLRRTLAFMEQSPLLQVVQQKLCATKFDDIVGATVQLESYGLRNLRVLWFDLRLCTSTLKPDPKGEGRAVRGAVDALLVLRNMRLCLVHDWEAKLATFPYLQLGGSSQVTVRSMGISLQLSVTHAEGVVFRDVDVVLPDVEVQLGCASSFSLVVLSAILKIFQSSLQEHLQRQMHRMLLHLLRREAGKWNESIWRHLMGVVPERLVSRGLGWFRARIPPEGLPI